MASKNLNGKGTLSNGKDMPTRGPKTAVKAPMPFKKGSK